MKNTVLFTAALLMLTNGQIFGQAQDALDNIQIKNVSRSVSVYLDSFSGQLNSDTGQNVFSGNEFEFGVSYSQNFATAQWLSIWVKTLVVTGTQGYYDDNRKFQGNIGYSVYGYGMPRAQLGVNFGGWSIIAMDTRGLLANENYYTLKLPSNQSLTFMTILEFWAIPQYRGDVKSEFVDDDGEQVKNKNYGLYKHTVLDLFALRMDYGVAFAKDWRYTTKLGLRFSDDASALRFGESFSVRWENQILYSVTPAFYMWGQVRYHISDIAIRSDAKHNVYLQAGLGYSFDFSDK